MRQPSFAEQAAATGYAEAVPHMPHEQARWAEALYKEAAVYDELLAKALQERDEAKAQRDILAYKEADYKAQRMFDNGNKVVSHLYGLVRDTNARLNGYKFSTDGAYKEENR